VSDYNPPKKAYRYSQEQFTKMKADYVAKNGYTITIPGFSDIVKFGTIPEPTKDEYKLYRKKDVEGLGQDRFDRISTLMKRKKEAFDRMMASPSPAWLQNIGTAMTAVDDVQDQLSTVSMLGRVGAATFPKLMAKWAVPAVGAVMTVNDILNLFTNVLMSPINAITKKDYLRRMTLSNPKTNMAKVKHSIKVKKIWPNKGEIIEGLQATNTWFGIGLSLGGIMGAIQDSFVGPIRTLMGQKVNVKWPIPKPSEWELRSMETLQSSQIMQMGADIFSDEMHCQSYIVTKMAQQALWPYYDQYDPIENVEGLENVLITPPKPKSYLTLQILEEAGIDPAGASGIPYRHGKDVTVRELGEIVQDHAVENYETVMSRMKTTPLGHIGSQMMNDIGLQGVAVMEGPENIDRDYLPEVKAMFTLADNGYCFRKELTEDEINCFRHAVNNLAPDPFNISGKELWSLLRNACNIWLTYAPKENTYYE
jgi:hypothetical protein